MAEKKEAAPVKVRITRKEGHRHAGKLVAEGEVLSVNEAQAVFIEKHKIGERVDAVKEA